MILYRNILSPEVMETRSFYVHIPCFAQLFLKFFFWSIWHIDGIQPLHDKVDLGVATLKRNSILLRSPKMKPYHQIQFTVIARISLFLGDGLTSLKGTQSVYSKPLAQCSSNRKWNNFLPNSKINNNSVVYAITLCLIIILS